MRILHLINDIRKLGNGIVNVTVDLACLHSQSGHTVAVACGPSGQGVEDYGPLLSHYHVQQLYFDQTRTLPRILYLLRRYRQIIQYFQPDIVHAHNITGVLLASALRFTSKYSLVSTVHNEFKRNAILMGLADRTIAVSHSNLTTLQQRGIPKDKLRVVHNGTIGSPRQQSSSIDAPLALKQPAIVTVAGLYHHKGISDVIAGFNQIAATVPDANLYIIGEGPDRAAFEAQRQASTFSHRIHFEGFQPDPQRYLHATDIFVLASRHESFGLAISEARAAGCAIVASRVGGIPEVLDCGQAGLLIPPAKSDLLAKTLIQLLTQKEYLDYWKQMAQQNLDHLEVHRVCQDTLVIYKELISKDNYG